MSDVIDRRNWNINCAGNSNDLLQAFVGMDNCGVDLKKVRDSSSESTVAPRLTAHLVSRHSMGLRGHELRGAKGISYFLPDYLRNNSPIDGCNAWLDISDCRIQLWTESGPEYF
jgi:hypothetical protein